MEQRAQELLKKDVALWTDEECNYFDSVHPISCRVARASAQKMKEALTELEVLQSWLRAGKVKGYAIECPNCKVQYNVSGNELHYNEPIKCLDCGTEYIQNEHIYGIVLREEENAD